MTSFRPELTDIENLAVRLVDLLELRHTTNGQGDYEAIGVFESCLAIRVLAEIKSPLPDSPAEEPAPLIHYTDHHGGVVCNPHLTSDGVETTENRSKVTCSICSLIKPVPVSTFPDNCPKCGADWRYKSKTMGRAYNQTHHGVCVNGHNWIEQ